MEMLPNTWDGATRPIVENVDSFAMRNRQRVRENQQRDEEYQQSSQVKEAIANMPKPVPKAPRPTAPQEPKSQSQETQSQSQETQPQQSQPQEPQASQEPQKPQSPSFQQTVNDIMMVDDYDEMTRHEAGPGAHEEDPVDPNEKTGTLGNQPVPEPQSVPEAVFDASKIHRDAPADKNIMESFAAGASNLAGAAASTVLGANIGAMAGVPGFGAYSAFTAYQAVRDNYLTTTRNQRMAHAITNTLADNLSRQIYRGQPVTGQPVQAISSLDTLGQLNRVSSAVTQVLAPTGVGGDQVNLAQRSFQNYLRHAIAPYAVDT